VAKIKVINNKLDGNLNGGDFTDNPSNIIFSFGSFFVTSNFEGKKNITYQNTLNNFVRPVTLETLNLTDIQSNIIETKSKSFVLNFDNKDLNTFVRFGSAYDFLRISIENIILKYPSSLFANSLRLGNNPIPTFSGCNYNDVTNISTFYVLVDCIENRFGMVFNKDNETIPDNDVLKNLNLSYNDFVISTASNYDKSYPIIGYTGNTINSTNPTLRNFIKFKVIGNPFSDVMTGNTNGIGFINFHIKPNNIKFEEFRAQLKPYERYIMSERVGVDGFKFVLKNPTLDDNGEIIYVDKTLIWTTTDGYNIDFDNNAYRNFLNAVLAIGDKYDKIKTNLIIRMLVPSSVITYDLTENRKISKLLKIYGWEFDQIRGFIDSLMYINKITYDKINNTPDIIIKNIARTFGWDYFNLLNENELVDSILTIDEQERNLHKDLLPAEIDIELWRRILLNTNYFWKSKGTRDAIKSIFLLIGIPEPFINITEYVYTVDGKINPQNVKLNIRDFPTQSLPYDNSGYPIAPLESNSFYFQVSGDTDGGQTYLNVFRKAGFILNETVDNKKSWVQSGATYRKHHTTPQYYQEDSRLIINTKEVDIALDVARGIEYDVYKYIKDYDFPVNNSGYTLPYSYVNISLNYTGTQNTFTLPFEYDNTQGDLEVRFNGILLNAPKTGVTNNVLTNADYVVTGNTFTILNDNYAKNYGNHRDVIQATFIYSSDEPISGITVNYIVTRIKANLTGTIIPLPTTPRGDVQVTINGIALSKGTPQYTADYNINYNTNEIIILNQDVISYLVDNPEVQVSYVEVINNNDISLKNETVRIDSFSNSKIYYSANANKYVYKLNYKVNDAKDIKFLVDGIALEPIKDYSINTLNPYEVFLPKGLRYGSVLSVYYLVGGNTVYKPVVSDSFSIGDISKLSFLEFLELIQRKMINARNRKTITDSKGGWYSTVLKIYETYLKRSELEINNPLHSNGYSFSNLYQFLNKYNAFFNRFVEQLLSSTIILKKGGLLVRNSIFTKQKYVYKRGVNVHENAILNFDNVNTTIKNRSTLYHLGDDGSVFTIPVEYNTPSPIELYVDTKLGYAGIGKLVDIGGENIVNYENITQYGIQYKETISNNWIQYPLLTQPLTTNNFTLTITGLSENTSYDYRAIVYLNNISATGDTKTLTTLATPPLPVPSGKTKLMTSSTTTSIIGTGGYDIQRYQDVDWYGVQYEPIGTTIIDFNVTPTQFTNVPASNTGLTVTVCGDISNCYDVSTNESWFILSIPNPPIPQGNSYNIGVKANTSTSPRTGTICFIPQSGDTKTVCVTQLGSPIVTIPVNVCYYPNNGVDYYTCTTCSRRGGYVTKPQNGECFNVKLDYSISKCSTPLITESCVWVKCNGSEIFSCEIVSKIAKEICGTFGVVTVTPNTCLELFAYAETTSSRIPSISKIYINEVNNICGNYCLGGSNQIVAGAGLV